MSSTTEVVNVRVTNIRPKYKNLKDWCEDPANVYIGRGGIVFIDGQRYPPVWSKWANPFKVGQDDMPREEAIKRYKLFIENKFGTQLKEELQKLKGKNLGCWCKPEPCHGDILKSMIEELCD